MYIMQKFPKLQDLTILHSPYEITVERHTTVIKDMISFLQYANTIKKFSVTLKLSNGDLFEFWKIWGREIDLEIKIHFFFQYSAREGPKSTSIIAFKNDIILIQSFFNLSTAYVIFRENCIHNIGYVVESLKITEKGNFGKSSSRNKYSYCILGSSTSLQELIIEGSIVHYNEFRPFLPHSELRSLSVGISELDDSRHKYLEYFFLEAPNLKQLYLFDRENWSGNKRWCITISMSSINFDLITWTCKNADLIKEDPQGTIKVRSLSIIRAFTCSKKYLFPIAAGNTEI